MTRRTLFQLAASAVAAPLAASAAVVPLQEKPIVAHRDHPIEIDIADPAAANYRRDDRVEVYALLQELHPGDPGDLSGAALRLSECGKYTTLWAGFGIHCLGLLFDGDLARLAEFDLTDRNVDLAMFLCEVYPQIQPYRWSGVYVKLSGGEDPRLTLGVGLDHCLGVLRGRNLNALLECVRARCDMDVQ